MTNTLLSGTFAQSREDRINFVTLVRLLSRIYQRGSHYMDFREI
jgi:hypothetical protein